MSSINGFFTAQWKQKRTETWDLRPEKEPDKLKIYADQFNFCVNVWLRFNIKEEKNNGLQKWTGLTRDAIDDNKF